ncbi:MAG: metallophosphoesterase [Turicibacter sp.]|nr:metallophosphoesterase [Turicibacter sp.]
MTYAISDLHGCYGKYKAMLEKIDFSDNDTLYILGDIIDRGEQPIEILLDMSRRANVIPILGNHEYMAYNSLKLLSSEVTEENIEKYFAGDAEEFLLDMTTWLTNGGKPTIEGFKRINQDEREAVLEYISDFLLYEIIDVSDKKFCLTHVGLPEGATDSNLHKYDIHDFLTVKTDYGKAVFEDAFLVTGHLPTFLIDENFRGRIYNKHNHLAIDTGAIFGEKLACVCLETFQEFYV